MKYLPDFAVLLLIFFLCLPRWKQAGKQAILFRTLFFVYLTAVVFFTLMPVLAQLPYLFDHPYVPMVMEPLRDLTHGYGDDAVLQLVLNTLLFLPFGFLLPFVKKQGFFSVLVKALCLSLAIELLQPLLSGARSSDITDVMTNTLGAVLGFLLQLPLRKTVLRIFREKPAA